MKTEFRFVEFRQDGNRLSGPVVVYGDRARFGEFTERFEPGSLRFEDVIVNLQHDRGRPVARTGAGLTLTDSTSELRAEIDLPETSYAREARELVDARIIRGFSMEFLAERDEWRANERVVQSARLVGIGLVDRPAYSASMIAQRWEDMLTGISLPATRKVWF